MSRVDNYIVGFGSVSALGAEKSEAWKRATSGKPAFVMREFDGAPTAVAPLAASAEERVRKLLGAHAHLESLDRTVLLAVLATQDALQGARWSPADKSNLGLSLGSSRGATGLFEKYFADYLQAEEARIPPRTSPTTTLGNLSSNVAQFLSLSGPVCDHSITCSTALHAFGNALAWLKSGMAKRYLVGGTEAALTPFTIAQMRALRIYSSLEAADWPCRPFEGKRNTLVLGEGAGVFAVECLSEEERAERAGAQAHFRIDAFASAMETQESHTSLSAEGVSLRRSMQDAMRQLNGKRVDAVVAHAPGTLQGDAGELKAINDVFGENCPAILSNKWLLGHTFGASGALSLEYALMLLLGGENLPFPYEVREKGIQACVNPPQRIMVNAAGFGGNAVSLVVSRA